MCVRLWIFFSVFSCSYLLSITWCHIKTYGYNIHLLILMVTNTSVPFFFILNAYLNLSSCIIWNIFCRFSPELTRVYVWRCDVVQRLNRFGCSLLSNNDIYSQFFDRCQNLFYAFLFWCVACALRAVCSRMRVYLSSKNDVFRFFPRNTLSLELRYIQITHKYSIYVCMSIYYWILIFIVFRCHTNDWGESG